MGPSASPLPPPPIGGIASNTAFAATVQPGSPGAQQPTLPSGQSLHLGDTAPSAVLRAAMNEGGKAAKPAVRWYTPSLDGNTPFPAPPSSSVPSLPTPPIADDKPKQPKPRRLIVIAMALTVVLVLAAVLANYFSPQ
jgi:hypothetical protein